MAASEGLDAISLMLGELKSSVAAIETYIHEKRHEENNLALKVEALGIRITRDIAAVEGRIEGRITAMDDRVRSLENDKNRRDGAVGLMSWFAKHWPFAGIMALLAAWVAWANGRLG